MSWEFENAWNARICPRVSSEGCGAPRHTSSDVFRILFIFLLRFLYVFVFVFVSIVIFAWERLWGMAHIDTKSWDDFEIEDSESTHYTLYISYIIHCIKSSYKITGKCFCSCWPVVKYINKYKYKEYQLYWNYIIWDCFMKLLWYLYLYLCTLLAFICCPLKNWPAAEEFSATATQTSEYVSLNLTFSCCQDLLSGYFI